MVNDLISCQSDFLPASVNRSFSRAVISAKVHKEFLENIILPLRVEKFRQG